MKKILRLTILLAAALGGAAAARGADQPQWGQRNTRNMVSAETGLPDTADPKSGKNVKWKVQLGSQTFCTPSVGEGCVLIGTNNENPRDPRQKGDRCILLCLDEKDGSLRWQLVVPKLEGDQYKDWPNVGLCSAPTIEGNRVYTLTNRAEVVCLTLAGMADGNAGPFKDEARHMATSRSGPIEPGPKDADIVWLFDMPAEAGIWPHDAANCSILIDNDYLYINTGNGVDNTHHKVRAPEAPSLIVLDKKTGRLVARDNEAIGTQIIHSTWSSPALGDVGGRAMVIYAGGDGVVRGLKALPHGFTAGRASDAATSEDGTTVSPGAPLKLEKIWSFDPDPTHPRYADHRFMDHRPDGPSDINGMPVLVKERVRGRRRRFSVGQARRLGQVHRRHEDRRPHGDFRRGGYHEDRRDLVLCHEADVLHTSGGRWPGLRDRLRRHNPLPRRRHRQTVLDAGREGRNLGLGPGGRRQGLRRKQGRPTLDPGGHAGEEGPGHGRDGLADLQHARGRQRRALRRHGGNSVCAGRAGTEVGREGVTRNPG
jgi:hypothetical protein